ncbi:hypothetical protein THOM_2848 [Trachipleistophora hominis]|uniref:Uncharacterized protein n=1 Tax=Trachipleistophora hominis TaxID=72359 RepID=L7JT79_TRAHO|nr:hypothetical protein THOM_2848 [Trachipleistophora hominis]
MFNFFLLLVLRTYIQAEPYKIKNSRANTYIGLEGDYPTWLPLAKSNTFKEKPSETEGRVLIEVVEISGKVWDIEGSVKNLIFFHEHGGANQRFLVKRSDNGITRILSGDRCITFVKSNNRFEKQPCVDGTVDQEFLIADENGVTVRTPDSSPTTKHMGFMDEDGSDQSMALEMALEAYLGAGGESGGSNALTAATKGFWAAGGSVDPTEIGTTDALLIAAQAYLRSAGVANASKMNASKAMAALARVHPVAKK